MVKASRTGGHDFDFRQGQRINEKMNIYFRSGCIYAYVCESCLVSKTQDKFKWGAISMKAYVGECHI